MLQVEVELKAQLKAQCKAQRLSEDIEFQWILPATSLESASSPVAMLCNGTQSCAELHDTILHPSGSDMFQCMALNNQANSIRLPRIWMEISAIQLKREMQTITKAQPRPKSSKLALA